MSDQPQTETSENEATVLSSEPKLAADLRGVYDVPVRVSVVLGRSKVEINQLLSINEGTVLQLDRKVGDAVDVLVNNRLIARGEVVLIDNRIGVTMTEIIKPEEA